MTSECDYAGTTAEHHKQPGLKPVADLPPITPETARHLAAILAPHLVAMRAVTAGTPYADAGGSVCEEGLGVSEEGLGAQPAPAVSPATKIFIAGMLQRIPA